MLEKFCYFAIFKDRIHFVFWCQVNGLQGYCMDPNPLEEEHQNNLEAALRLFDDVAKMGGDAFSQTYRMQLENDILNYYATTARHNEKAWQVKG